MSIEKMREEFERTNGRDHRRNPPKGNNYTDPMAQADWESFQKGWKQSRAAMVIELPIRQSIEKDTGLGYNCAIHHCREAIEAAGVKVKP